MVNINNNYNSGINSSSIYTNNTNSSDTNSTAQDTLNYFNDLKNRYPNTNLELGAGYDNITNKTNVCISPNEIKRALDDPKEQAILEANIKSINDGMGFTNMFNTLPDGRKVTSISYYIDDKCQISANITYSKPPKRKTNNDNQKKLLEKKWREKKLKEKKMKEKQLKNMQRKKILKRRKKRLKNIQIKRFEGNKVKISQMHLKKLITQKYNFHINKLV